MPRKTHGNGGLEALRYTGGHTVQNPKTGYIWEYCPDHPGCTLRGMVLQARLVMERHLGRFLSGQEVVHHRNGDKTDNHLDNLELLPSQSKHIEYHQKSRRTVQPEFLRTLHRLAESPHVTVAQAAEQMQCSHMTVHNVCKRQGWKWRSVHAEGKGGLHSSGHVLAVLRSHSRKESEQILGMSVMSLWRHFPEEMNMTARKKSLKSGDRLGGTVKRGFHDGPPRTPSSPDDGGESLYADPGALPPDPPLPLAGWRV